MTTETNTITANDFDDVQGADDAAFASGARVTGGFDGPSWVPMLAAEHSDLKDSKRLEKIEKAGKGSTTRPTLRGLLHAEFAWGRRLYFLAVKTKTAGVVKVKLPESKILWDGLNLAELVGGAPDVAIRYDGRGKAKAGRTAPHLYTVVIMDPKKLRATPRPDAMTPQSIDEREAEKAAKDLKAARAAAKAAKAAADDADDDGDDEGEAAPY